MIESNIGQISKRTWYKWSFYVNIVLFFVVAISILLLIVDSFNAGIAYNRDALSPLSQNWLLVARDIAFLAISLTLIFFQFFGNIVKIMRRSL
jgi:hypothetical protein